MSADNVEVMRRAWDAWMRGDLEAVYDVYDEDAIWDLSHFSEWPEDRFHGIAAIDRFFRDWLAIWDDYEVGVDEILAAPDGRVVTLYWHRGTGHHSRLAMDWSGAQVSTIRDGKVTLMELYDDRAEALAAVGLTAAP